MRKAKKKKLKIGERFGLIIAIIVVFLFFSIAGEYFCTFYNLNNIIKNSSILIVAAIGTTMAILSAHNDISIGSIMSLSGIVAAFLMGHGFSVIPATLIAVLVGTICGMINGALISFAGADFWIVTFAMLSIAEGLAIVISQGETLASFPDSFNNLARGSVLGINNLAFIALVIVIVALFVLRKTKLGYDVYAVGDSELCAELSGIKTKKIKFLVFTFGGMFAGVAGIMLAAKNCAALPTGGSGFEFDAIAATFVGGAANTGGKGSYAGTVLGAILITLIRNGLSMIGVPSLWQYLLIGLIILLVIIYDITKTRFDEIRDNERRYVDE